MVETEDTAAYEPTLSTFVWLSIKDFVGEAVSDSAAKTDYDANQLYAAASRLVAWTWQRAGLPLDRRLVFAFTTIERFVDSGLPQYRSAARRNTTRSRLLRMSEILLPPPDKMNQLRLLGASDPTAPYSPADTTALRSWAAQQPTAERRSNAAALLSPGMGAGLGSLELAALHASDVVDDAEGLLVHASRVRPPVWTSSTPTISASTTGLLTVASYAEARCDRS